MKTTVTQKGTFDSRVKIDRRTDGTFLLTSEKLNGDDLARTGLTAGELDALVKRAQDLLVPPAPTPAPSYRLERNFDDGSAEGMAMYIGEGFASRFEAGRLVLQQTEQVSGSFARVWFSNVGWRKGMDVSYGGEFELSDPLALAYTTLIAGDNYPQARVGVVVEAGAAKLVTTLYGGVERVIGNFAVPAAKPFDLRVRQVLSDVSGQAVNEVFVNGERVVSTSTANLVAADQTVNQMRYGFVSQSARSRPSTITLDRLYAS